MQNYESLKLDLKDSCISSVKPFKFSRWHSGFNYFTGEFKGKKVFIKICCGKYNTIPAESFLKNYKNFDKCPQIIGFSTQKYNWIATEFEELVALDQLKDIKDIHAIIRQAALILDNLYTCGIIHRDLRPENICINPVGNLLLIDFGWAVYKSRSFQKTEYEFIEKILNQQYRDQNGKHDDALSMYNSFKYVFPFLTEQDLLPISEKIGRLSI